MSIWPPFMSTRPSVCTNNPPPFVATFRLSGGTDNHPPPVAVPVAVVVEPPKTVVEAAVHTAAVAIHQQSKSIYHRELDLEDGDAPHK